MQLIESLDGHVLKLPVMLSLLLGLRRGEVLGLKWENVDLENGRINIVNTITKAGSRLIEKTPKTEKSYRCLVIPDSLMPVLEAQKSNQEACSSRNRKYNNSGYVVTSKNGSTYSPNYLSDSFRKYVVQHGFKTIRFHDLRHSFASIANAAGVPMSEISSTLGHSNISTTSDIYTHEFSPVKSKAISAVENMIDHEKVAV